MIMHENMWITRLFSNLTTVTNYRSVDEYYITVQYINISFLIVEIILTKYNFYFIFLFFLDISCLYSTFHLEYPLLLSRFCFIRSEIGKSKKRRAFMIPILHRSVSPRDEFCNIQYTARRASQGQSQPVKSTALWSHAPCTWWKILLTSRKRRRNMAF